MSDRSPLVRPLVIALLAAVLALCLAPQAQARMLRLERLTPQQLQRMPEIAVEEYEMALAALDRVLYQDALEHLRAAAEEDSENPQLRLMIVQLATYLGDTRQGSESIRFYDIALLSLRRLSDSPLLNLREKRRAAEYLDKITELQRTVVERDEARKEWGREIAKMYREDLRAGRGEDDEDELRERLRSREELIDLLGAEALAEEVEEEVLVDTLLSEEPVGGVGPADEIIEGRVPDEVLIEQALEEEAAEEIEVITPGDTVDVIDDDLLGMDEATEDDVPDDFFTIEQQDVEVEPTIEIDSVDDEVTTN